MFTIDFNDGIMLILDCKIVQIEWGMSIVCLDIIDVGHLQTILETFS